MNQQQPSPPAVDEQPPYTGGSLGRGIVWSLLVAEMERERDERSNPEEPTLRSAA